MTDEIANLKHELEHLKRWHVGTGSTFTDVGDKLIAVAELNLKIAELLLKADK